MKIAILDDYQDVASSLADWGSLAAEMVVFTKAFRDADEAVRSLAGFDVLVAMRERTRFPAEVLERLTGHVAYVTRDLHTIFYQDAVEDIAAYQAGSPIRLME
jgi:phosphoglycerate dehydrogenase-like enzyme